jgi:hypothetical protein
VERASSTIRPRNELIPTGRSCRTLNQISTFEFRPVEMTTPLRATDSPHWVDCRRETFFQSPSWRLTKALNTLIGSDWHTPAVEGFSANALPLTPAQQKMIEIAVVGSVLLERFCAIPFERSIFPVPKETADPGFLEQQFSVFF